MTKGIPELYGSLVFNNRVMRDKLPKVFTGRYAKPLKIIRIWSWMWPTLWLWQ